MNTPTYHSRSITEKNKADLPRRDQSPSELNHLKIAAFHKYQTQAASPKAYHYIRYISEMNPPSVSWFIPQTSLQESTQNHILCQVSVDTSKTRRHLQLQWRNLTHLDVNRNVTFYLVHLWSRLLNSCYRRLSYSIELTFFDTIVWKWSFIWWGIIFYGRSCDHAINSEFTEI